MMLETFKKFMSDREAETMYITGQAGTGKTTSLGELIQFCIDYGIVYHVCAYTHTACDILRSKLPREAEDHISTLHSFLKKRPTINPDANHVKKLEGNSTAGTHEIPIDVLWIDELSQIGEKDNQDVVAKQYELEDEYPNMKVVYIGDPNQLPPVGDMPGVEPYGDYHIHLDKIYRQASDNMLIIPLTQLVGFINGKKPEPLVTGDNFIRDKEYLLEDYKKEEGNKILLAYTNQRVQDMNFEIMGRDKPIPGDRLFSPTAHEYFEFIDFCPSELVGEVQQYNGTLKLGTKYRSLEKIIEYNLCEFYELKNLSTNQIGLYPVIFGTKNYMNAKDEAAELAVKVNKEIETTHNVDKAAIWAKLNWQDPLAKKRGKAWSKYLSIKSNIFSMDFAHAMTIHKAQGSTYKTVFLDTLDLAKCMDRDYIMYCKLFYVALSRASDKVITN